MCIWDPIYQGSKLHNQAGACIMLALLAAGLLPSTSTQASVAIAAVSSWCICNASESERQYRYALEYAYSCASCTGSHEHDALHLFSNCMPSGDDLASNCLSVKCHEYTQQHRSCQISLIHERYRKWACWYSWCFIHFRALRAWHESLWAGSSSHGGLPRYFLAEMLPQHNVLTWA